MTKTKPKPPPVYGDDLPITPFQIKRIMQNCQYNIDMKNEWVQWATSDVARTSLKSLTQAQAVKIICQQTGTQPLTPPEKRGTTTDNSPYEGWGAFDKTNPKHKVILSILYQAQWVKPSEKWGEVPDLDRLSNFLQSEKSPVKKKLKDMDSLELEKLIKALNGIVKHRYK